MEFANVGYYQQENTEPTRNESVSVGTSNVLISNSNTRRKVLYFKNTSTAAQIISVSYGDVAVAGQGFVLQPNEYIIESMSEGYIVFQGTVNAISSAAGGTLAVQER